MTVDAKGSFTAETLTINGTDKLSVSGGKATIGTAEISAGGIVLTEDVKREIKVHQLRGLRVHHSLVELL